MRNLFRKQPRLIYIFIWIIILFVHGVVLNLIYEYSLGISLLDATVFNLIFAIIGVGLWFMVRYSNLSSRPLSELIYSHIASSGITLLIWISLGYFILKNIPTSNTDYQEFLKSSLVFRGISGFFYYAVIVTIYYLINNFKELQEKMDHEAELNRMLREAELNMLRSQIRPHFLFNSLNSISSLTMSNPDRAQDMVIKLSEFMRYSLNYKDEKLISLKEEIYHIQLYLEIEKVRFGDKLKIDFQIQDMCNYYKLPALILQPIVENSVKYGLYEATGEIGIKIIASCSKGFLHIKCGNDFDPDSTPQKGTGTGLKNIQKRLETVYAGFEFMNIYKSENYFEVELKIPQYVKD